MSRPAAAGLALSVVLSAVSARGDVGDVVAEAAVRLAAEAVAAMTGKLIEYALEPSRSESAAHPELSEWRDPATRSTSRMQRGCGVFLETTLTGSPEQNFLNVVAVNETAAPLRVVPALVRFGSGAGGRLKRGELQLAAHARAALSVPFPSKSDFADQRSLDVVFAVDRCWLTVRYERLRNAPRDPESYLEYSKLELWLGGGLRFAASGGPKTFGRSDGVAIETGIARYFSPQHGFSLELLSDTDSEPTHHVSGLGFATGYVLRVHALSWLSLTYGPALGAASYSLHDGVTDEQTWAFVFQQRLRLQARLFHHGDFGTVSLAPSLVYQVLADGDLAGVGVRGSTAAAMLSLGGGL